MTTEKIDPKVLNLYDEYCHGFIDRREFMNRATVMTVGGVSALAMATSLLPRYAEAQTISFTDERIKANYVTYPSPGGTSGEMRGYLVQPTSGSGPFKPVLVIHENRGLNPHIEDVARRFAAAGFLALAPDGLAPVGGYPGNDDDGRSLQSSLDRNALLQDLVNSAEYLDSHELASDKLGVTGFCFGGYATNYIAAQLGDKVQAAVPFYGSGVSAEEAANIKAALLVQSAENDQRINAAWPEYEAALQAAGVNYERHVYPGTAHGFHNNSTARFDEAQSEIAWDRMVAFFNEHLD
ncbi:MAG: dienelactone hydrolase family protein [Porticoccaceae bacterium]|jgi:carboxymethylenebutenolidase|nr:dienelactone hydrolase family protein [Porticoccaceae bacterium]